MDSLLKVLDKTISERPVYAAEKVSRIDELKSKLVKNLPPLEDEFNINEVLFQNTNRLYVILLLLISIRIYLSQKN